MPKDESEIRFMAPGGDVAILDGYCSGISADRSSVMRSLLHEWADRKLHEATMVLRVARGNPSSSEDDRKEGGK